MAKKLYPAVVGMMAMLLPGILVAQTPVGDPWGLELIKLAGVFDPGMPDPSVSYDGTNLFYAITSAGHDIGDSEDGCAFAQALFHGDFSVVARVEEEFSGPASDPWSKAGLMVRDALTAGSKMVFYGTSRFSGDALMIWRDLENTDTDWPGLPDEQGGLDPPFYVRLDRRGDEFTGYYSRDGTHWSRGTTHTNPAFGEPAFVGMTVSSAEELQEATMRFGQFSLDGRPPDLVFFEDFEDGVADGFEAAGGTWTVTNGQYHQTRTGGEGGLNTRSWVAAGDVSNYVVEVELTPLSTDTTRIFYTRGDLSFDYRVEFWNGGSRICIPALGESWDIRYYDSEDGLAFVSGQVYAAKLDVGRSGVKVWLDGLLRHNETWAGDVPLGDGKVGVGTQHGPAAFDDVKVSMRLPEAQLQVLSSATTGLALRIGLPRMKLLPVTLTDSNTYAMVVTPGTSFGKVGKPAVPELAAWILVPNGTTPELSVQTGEQVLLENIVLGPVQPPRADAEGAPVPAFTKDAATYNLNTNWPGVWAELGPVEMLRGHPCALLRIYPYQYNPVTRQLLADVDLDIRITFNGTPVGVPARLKSELSDWTLWKMAVNDDPVLQIPDVESVFETEYGYDYLILTPTGMVMAADKLAAWKKQCGYKVRVDAREWSLLWPDQIIESLVHAYTNWPIVPKYVLLLGDAEHIPCDYRTWHSYNQGIVSTCGMVFSNTQGLIGTDLYYSLLEGPHPQPPASDLLPEIAVGRLPVSSLIEALEAVDRIIWYEKLPPPSNSAFFSNIVLCAYFQDVAECGMVADGVEDSRYAQTAEDLAIFFSDPKYKINKSVRRLYKADPSVSPAKWGANLVSLGNFGGGPAGGAKDPIPAYLKKPGFAWNAQAADITTALEAGCFLAMHRDHGNRGRWSHPTFTNTDVTPLEFHAGYPVVWSVNCLSGWFDNETDFQTILGVSPVMSIPDLTQHSDECFSEFFLNRCAFGGAAGVLAPTRVTYGIINDRLLWGFTDAVWPQFIPQYAGTNRWATQRMGDVLNYGKLYMMSQVPDIAHRKECIEGFHWLGDPSMRVWAAPPGPITAEFDPNWAKALLSGLFTAQLKKQSLDLIPKELLKTAKLTITGPDGSSEFWTATPDDYGWVYIPDLTTRGIGEYRITVTAPNCAPYQAILLSVPGSAGGIVWNADFYTCPSRAVISMADNDLLGLDPQVVQVSTSGGDIEWVVLNVAPPTWAVFTGGVDVVLSAVVPGNGRLDVSHGDTLFAQYQDENDGNGNPTTVVAIAKIDAAAPTFGGLGSVSGDVGYAVLEWEPASDPAGPVTYTVYRSETPGTLGNAVGRTWMLCFADNTVEFGRAYYYTVRAADALGNEEANDVQRSVTCDFPFEIRRVEKRNEDGRASLIWNSRRGDWYAIGSCLNLLLDSWSPEDTVPAAGGSTAWWDPGAAGTGKFYRISLAPPP